MALIQETILQKLVNDETYCRKVLPFIKPEYFEGSGKVVYKLVLDFIGKYNKLPTGLTLSIDLDKADVREEHYPGAVQLINNLKVNPDVEEKWLIENTEKWCKDRAIYLGIMEAIKIIDGQNKELGPGAIPDILQKALSINFDDSVGHDYFIDSDDRFDFYHRVEERLPFDLEMLNKITKNGVSKKTLNVLMSGPGGGKSLTMVHLASSYLLQGKNVLYITLEMSEERIAERIDANLMNISTDQLSTLTKEAFADKVTSINAKTIGKLIVKEYPTAAAHVGHFRALLNELNLKKNFKPDVIFIDYLNICASSRIKGLSGSVNTNSFVKAISEEVRGLAIEFNVPIWSATQINRGGSTDSDPDMDNVAESFGLVATVDLFLALITTEELDKLGQIMVKQLKNRYGDIVTNKRFVLGIDRSKMKLYDVEDRAQSLLNASTKPTTDYSNFKIE